MFGGRGEEAGALGVGLDEVGHAFGLYGPSSAWTEPTDR